LAGAIPGLPRYNGPEEDLWSSIGPPHYSTHVEGLAFHGFFFLMNQMLAIVAAIRTAATIQSIQNIGPCKDSRPKILPTQSADTAVRRRVMFVLSMSLSVEIQGYRSDPARDH
jgi:hypothetical protein